MYSWRYRNNYNNIIQYRGRYYRKISKETQETLSTPPYHLRQRSRFLYFLFFVINNLHVRINPAFFHAAVTSTRPLRARLPYVARRRRRAFDYSNSVPGRSLKDSRHVPDASRPRQPAYYIHIVCLWVASYPTARWLTPTTLPPSTDGVSSIRPYHCRVYLPKYDELWTSGSSYPILYTDKVIFSCLLTIILDKNKNKILRKLFR